MALCSSPVLFSGTGQFEVSFFIKTLSPDACHSFGLALLPDTSDPIFETVDLAAWVGASKGSWALTSDGHIYSEGTYIRSIDMIPMQAGDMVSLRVDTDKGDPAPLQQPAGGTGAGPGARWRPCVTLEVFVNGRPVPGGRLTNAGSPACFACGSEGGDLRVEICGFDSPAARAIVEAERLEAEGRAALKRGDLAAALKGFKEAQEQYGLGGELAQARRAAARGLEDETIRRMAEVRALQQGLGWHKQAQTAMLGGEHVQAVDLLRAARTCYLAAGRPGQAKIHEMRDLVQDAVERAASEAAAARQGLL